MPKTNGGTVSVNRVVREIMEKDLFLNISLRNGYANLSGIARFIAPMVETRLGVLPTREAIMSAIKRSRDQTTNAEFAINSALASSSVKMTTGMTEAVIPNLYIARIMDEIKVPLSEGSIFLSVGIQDSTLLMDSKTFGELGRISKSHITSSRDGLSAIHILVPRSSLDTRGFLTTLFEKLSMNGINVAGTATSFSDLMIIVDDGQAGDAFNIVTDMIRFARISR